MGAGKDDHHHHHHGHHHHHHGDEEQQQQPPPPSPLQYGTFQGVANYPPQPVIGFPQPIPPPGLTASSSPYVHGYQAVPGYAVAEGRPFTREHRLPCCGIGFGWLLFIIGFLLGAIPWYIGAFVLLCARIDHREKPGYVACMIAAILATFAMVFGLTENDW